MGGDIGQHQRYYEECCGQPAGGFSQEGCRPTRTEYSTGSSAAERSAGIGAFAVLKQYQRNQRNRYQDQNSDKYGVHETV